MTAPLNAASPFSLSHGSVEVFRRQHQAWLLV